MILPGVWKSVARLSKKVKVICIFRFTVISASKNCPKWKQVPGRSGAGEKRVTALGAKVSGTKKWDKIVERSCVNL